MLNQAKKQPQKQEVPPLKWERAGDLGLSLFGWSESCLALSSELLVKQGELQDLLGFQACCKFWLRRLGGGGSRGSPLAFSGFLP